MAPRVIKKPEGVIKAIYPGFIKPALASSMGKVPEGDRWLHEVKFDGYRVQVHIINEAVKVFARNGHDWTDRFAKIARDAWRLNVKPRTEAEHYMKCPACGGYYDMRDLGAVYDHEYPLPHPACDQVQ